METCSLKGDYLSYLLRLWRENDEDRPVWRASLKQVQTGEQVGFTSLEGLFGFLREETNTVGSQETEEH